MSATNKPAGNVSVTPEPTEAVDPQQKMEDCPSGYPRFAAMTSSHPSLFAFRRFAALRARMILHKQDRLSELEARLQKVDRDEEKPIYRCSIRRDANPEREVLLRELDLVMSQYDNLSQSTQDALATKTAATRDVENISQWVDGFGCIAEDETTYLAHKRDLMSLGPAEDDDFLEMVAHGVEDVIIWVSELLGWDIRDDFSSHPGVYIFPDRLIETASRSVLAILASSLLLVPIVVLTLVEALAVRLAIVLVSNAGFVFVVSMLAKAKMGELFMAGAAYTAVMIVYISGTN